MNLDKRQNCPNCGSAMQVLLPIWITPGEDSIDTGDIDYESGMKKEGSNWYCNACDYNGFPEEDDEDENVYVVPLPDHWKTEVVKDDLQQEIKTKPAHSPAPWKYSEWTCGGGRAVGVSANEVCGRSICTFTAHPARDIDAANAHLIAAAPELLQALLLFVEQYQGNGNDERELRPEMKAARAAIAKAQGSNR